MKKNIVSLLSLALVSSFGLVNAQKKKDSIKTRDIGEVVVVAFGKQSKETMVGANSEIKAKDLSSRALTNVSQALEGASPGVQISATSGQPGGSLSVRIRGFSSINTTNEPLYIVDGSVYLGNLSNISSDDIESINILKDAASTSLYGSSAANGIVMITTKKGKKGRGQFNFSASTGIATRAVRDYARIGASDYYPIIWEALRNGALNDKQNPKTEAEAGAFASRHLISNVLFNNVYNVADKELIVDGKLNPNAKLKYDDLDWDKALFGTGIRHSYDLNYSGGTDNTSYFASIGYLKEDGYNFNSDFERINARVNVDSQVKRWLKIGTNIALSNSFYNFSDVSNGGFTNGFRWVRSIGPIYNIYAHDPVTGDYLYDANGNKIFDSGDKRGSNASSGRHIIHEMSANRNYNKVFSVNSRFFAEFKLLPELTLTTNASYDTQTFYGIVYNNKEVGDAAPVGAASRENSQRKTLNFNQLLNYNKSFGQHSFNALLGHESIEYTYDYIYGYKREQVVDGNIELANFVTPTDLTSYDLQLPKEGYFARVNYDFGKKYLLSGSVRRDASARFHRDVRWETFWSVGAGWNIDREAFLRNNQTINKLKLRGSYGEVGNDGNYNNKETSFYIWQPLYELGYNNTSFGGMMMGEIGNSKLTWETNKQFDLGIEFGLFNNRISGSVEYYKRGTNGLIFSVPKPDSSGNTSKKENIGNLENSGIEIAINADIVRTNDFRWSVNANTSTIKNTIKSLSQEEIITGTKKYKVGSSIFDYWLRQWYGVDPEDGSGLFYASDDAIANYETKKANGGTIADSEVIREIDGHKLTTDHNNAKYEYTGTALPKFFGSFGTSFRYKGFSLSALFTYQIGGKTYDSNYQDMMKAYTRGGALHTDILNRWQKKGDITEVPRMDYTAYVSPGALSSRWLVDSSYLTLKQLTISYEIPRVFLNSVGVNSLKLFVNGENIWTKTARQGLEPGGNFTGVTNHRFSPARIISFGLSTSF